jgi:polyisoprenoid-binding protein YceI
VRHLGLSTVSGIFNTFDPKVESTDDEDFSGTKGFTAGINSNSTGNYQRDGNLKTEDFFNAERLPKLSFSNGELKKIGKRRF